MYFNLMPTHTVRFSLIKVKNIRFFAIVVPSLFLFPALLVNAERPSSSTEKSALHNYTIFLAMPVDTPLTDSAPIALRRFVRSDTEYVVAVNPSDLSLKLLDAARFKWRECGWQELLDRYRETAYGKAILEARLAVLPIKDAGFNRFLPSQKGIDLTVDLCPSKRPLDRFFFDTLITALSTEETPVPIGISITGSWIKNHTDDLQWLVQLQNQNHIHITWINHSFNHYVMPAKDSSENFLRDKKSDLSEEILGTERLLINKGLIPSIFFRFPGLVSNPEFIVRVVSFGLIPVGSDAWLAKEEVPRNGSIVLVHANGNEPWGLKKFVSLLAEKQDSIKRKAWFLYDLRSSVIQAMDSSTAVH
jgi:hypothetical protein